MLLQHIWLQIAMTMAITTSIEKSTIMTMMAPWPYHSQCLLRSLFSEDSDDCFSSTSTLTHAVGEVWVSVEVAGFAMCFVP